MALQRPTGQKTTILAIILLLTLRIGLGFNFSSATDLSPDNIAKAVNKQRSQRNISTLAYNQRLAAAADFKAHDMIARSYFSHTDPDGKYIWDKISEEGYKPYTVLGENLAVDFFDTEGLMAAWIDSPTHRSNILNADYKDQGLGVADGNGGKYSIAIANTFGAQPSTQITQKVVTQPAPKPVETIPVPKTQPVETPKTETVTQKPSVEIDGNSVLINPSIENNKLKLGIYAKVFGKPNSVTATLQSNTITLDPSGLGYGGYFTLEKYFNYRSYNLVIEAKDNKGLATQIEVPLKGYPLPKTEDPKRLGDVSEKAAAPDLYNVFKYIVVVFGGLFILFMLLDALHLRNKQFSDIDKLRIGSNVILMFLVISTLLLVSWWH
ncbi:MAG: hypothetical protein G01um101477_168 [Candidatus Doudnabacteria bacterium Gr01-1014_77]|uniref:SCP domain-containing protein n=1 Tax=Candidatus Doudnabacteria bacterium Gr01-1014_77 TaxID=2017133 RepID=A0A554JCV7_9BACT|nr:MAG: hypothetical protein G01um101477_168 [Candidatus Doudnabacteria bacterium Gr01-1014_77]